MQEHILENMLKIHCCCFQQDIYPWTQKNLFTPFWRFYWNPEPGGFLQLPGGKEIAMTPEYFYIIPGYLCFSTTARSKTFKQFFIHFNLSDRQQNLPQVYTFPADQWAVDLIEEFIRNPAQTADRQLVFLRAAAVLSATLLKMPPGLLQLHPPADARIVRILELMDNEKNNCCHLSNDELAGTVGMSRAGFIRQFKNETGEPPQVYWCRKRIENACNLLRYGVLSIDEIAERTGFANRYHFSRVFTKLMRISPAKFRKKY